MDLINTYGNVGNDDIDNMQVCLDDQRTGFYQLTLSEMDTTTIPQVTAGSKIEVAGALYKANSAESISGSATTGTNYIYLVPGTGIVTPTWTTTAPTWSDAKQGWYGTGGSANYRYIKYRVEYDGASAYEKYRSLFFETIKTRMFAYLSAADLGAYTANNAVIIDTKKFDTKNEFNISTGIFTFTNSGYYRITCSFTSEVYTGFIYLNSAIRYQFNNVLASVYDFFNVGDTIYIGTTTNLSHQYGKGAGNYFKTFLQIDEL